MARLTGTLRYNAKVAKMAFYAMNEDHLLDTDERLDDGEIIIYALIFIKGYSNRKRQSRYTGGITKLAAMSAMRWHAVKEALDALEAKGLIKKTKDAFVSIKPRPKKNYLMVSSAILMSKVLSVQQKAFILRLAAIKASSQEDVIVNNTEIASILQVHRNTVSNTFNQMISVKWNKVWNDKFSDLASTRETAWITIQSSEVVINFDILHMLVTRELNEELIDYRQKEMRSISNKKIHEVTANDPDNIWLKVHGKTTEKKRKIINDIEELRADGVISTEKAITLLNYVLQSRLSYVKDYIEKINRV
jgi:Mn-dependent DtxR family transcriptional regulator